MARRDRYESVGYAHVSDVPMKEWEKPVARSSNASFSSEVAFMAICTLVFAGAAGAGWEFHWDWLLFAGVCALAGLWLAYALYLLRTTSVPFERIKYQDAVQREEDPVAADPNRVSLPTGDGRVVEFVQPRHGEFANWSAAIIRDVRDGNIPFREKTQLSQNTAGTRGWPRDMYKSMLAALRTVGWVSAGPNNTPVFTDYAVQCIDAWQKGKTPPPPSN